MITLFWFGITFWNLGLFFYFLYLEGFLPKSRVFLILGVAALLGNETFWSIFSSSFLLVFILIKLLFSSKQKIDQARIDATRIEDFKKYWAFYDDQP